MIVNATCLAYVLMDRWLSKREKTIRMVRRVWHVVRYVFRLAAASLCCICRRLCPKKEPEDTKDEESPPPSPEEQKAIIWDPQLLRERRLEWISGLSSELWAHFSQGSRAGELTMLQFTKLLDAWNPDYTPEDVEALLNALKESSAEEPWEISERRFEIWVAATFGVFDHEVQIAVLDELTAPLTTFGALGGQDTFFNFFPEQSEQMVEEVPLVLRACGMQLFIDYGVGSCLSTGEFAHRVEPSNLKAIVEGLECEESLSTHHPLHRDDFYEWLRECFRNMEEDTILQHLLHLRRGKAEDVPQRILLNLASIARSLWRVRLSGLDQPGVGSLSYMQVEAAHHAANIGTEIDFNASMDSQHPDLDGQFKKAFAQYLLNDDGFIRSAEDFQFLTVSLCSQLKQQGVLQDEIGMHKALETPLITISRAAYVWSKEEYQEWFAGTFIDKRACQPMSKMSSACSICSQTISEYCVHVPCCHATPGVCYGCSTQNSLVCVYCRMPGTAVAIPAIWTDSGTAQIVEDSWQDNFLAGVAEEEKATVGESWQDNMDNFLAGVTEEKATAAPYAAKKKTAEEESWQDNMDNFLAGVAEKEATALPYAAKKNPIVEESWQDNPLARVAEKEATAAPYAAKKKGSSRRFLAGQFPGRYGRRGGCCSCLCCPERGGKAPLECP